MHISYKQIETCGEGLLKSVILMGVVTHFRENQEKGCEFHFWVSVTVKRREELQVVRLHKRGNKKRGT